MLYTMRVCEQAQADDTNAAPHLCGLTYGSDVLEPGDMQTFTMVVDNDTCSDGAVFTMLGMLGMVATHDTLGVERFGSNVCDSHLWNDP